MLTKPTLYSTAVNLSVATLSLSLGACAAGEDFRPTQTSGGFSVGSDSDGGSDTDGDGDGDTDTDGGTGDDGEDQGVLASETQDLFATKCSKCHGEGSAKLGGIDYITDLTALVTNGEVERYDPEASNIFKRVTSATSPMPPVSQDDALTVDEIELVRSWILVGAPPAPANADCLDNDFISLDEMAKEMAADISFALNNEDDRKFTRYITLTHLHNSGLCSSEIDVYRAAIAKVLNSLSREPLIAAPEEISGDGLILRIDLRDYGWEQGNNAVIETKGSSDAWEATVIANPFAIEFNGFPIDDLKADAGTSVPFQAGDAFLQAITRGELYYDLLEIPENVGGLETELGVPALEDPDLKDGEISRASFRESGVSNSNRIIERRQVGDTGFRAYWRSYDFADESGKGDVFAHPIDFEEAGGEIIFNLENGMQGYMLIDQAGNRLLDAPTAIVSDPGQQDSVVKNGISCMRCHSDGIIQKPDEFLPFFNLNKNDFVGEDFDFIERLYRPGDELLDLQGNDAANFRAAMVKAGIDPRIDEPIYAVSSAFEANLDLLRAAAEFGIPAERLDQELAILDLKLQNLRDGTVQREPFEEVYRDSICALLPIGEIQPTCPVGE